MTRSSRNSYAVIGLIGPGDPSKKERFVRFLENSLKRIFKAVESKKVTDENDEEFKKVDRWGNEIDCKRCVSQLNRQEGKQVVVIKEKLRDGKEEKKQEFAQFVFYRGIYKKKEF